MYFVLDYDTQAVMAICYFEDVAYAIAGNLPNHCVVRYCEEMNVMYAEHTNFFDKEITKTA